ncbi:MULTISPECIES: hypothetical protein [Rhizobium]|uniref:Uncharacterized protein n=1 Tax=Rhizobium rhododendri TaxID=2506430 RepID=A0ABY8IID3_9HYPH|nr:MULTISPECIES: hypothetical protein [Rhizobium]MBZ5761124.1 hypothetical protein [Rhizobium sp. VS19-DR96]MBZ5767188.1 hypothetical protein [Rhizobium sp. VS19-DR129.2]MBZ5773523.1 hypothetical protein [Rhizobium sp. VS19-DRK62.2]MBZ5785500.1 hypothetical protein [Rhizobium sp. VS19-DR121]MBZ5802321.1 hypothetical protein [Rhizobium sp. VS19-DR181]
MSNPHTETGGPYKSDRNFVSGRQAAQTQYAEGGNASYGSIRQEEDGEALQTQSADTLVMLQLASFEGRAM